MPRSRPKVYAHKRHKKVLKFTKGQYGSRSKLFKRANEAMMKSLFYAYRDRRNRKRSFRALWITRITAACRMRGSSYQQIINGLKVAEISLNRKMLSEIAIADPEAFDKLLATALAARQANNAAA